jgi:hypothetical protein
MTPDLQGYMVTMVNTRSPILALSYWVNARSVALDLLPPLSDTVPFRHPLLPVSRPSPDPTQFPSLLISYVATLLSPRLLYIWFLRLVAQSAASCSPLADYSTLKSEAILFSETLVNPSSTQRHIPPL